MKSDLLLDTNLQSLARRLEVVSDYQKKMNNEIVSITMGLTQSDMYFGVVFYEPLPPEVKEPAVAAKVLPIDGCRFHSSPEPFTPGGCVSVPEPVAAVPIPGSRVPEEGTDWCGVCNPGTSEHLCNKHIKERLDGMTECIEAFPGAKTGDGKLGFGHDRPKSLSEQMEEILEPRPWDHGPVHVNAHGRE